MSEWQKSKEARRAAYIEKLKDPRWQKLRLQVFERDGWACMVCGSDRETLNVHHLYYESGNEPWEYPLEALLTLCQDCHQSMTDLQNNEEQGLLRLLRQKGYLGQDVADLASLIYHLPTPDHIGLMMSSIQHHLTQPGAIAKVITERADYLSERRKAREQQEEQASKDNEASQ